VEVEKKAVLHILKWKIVNIGISDNTIEEY
jgi:hypothetical protein